MLFRVCQNFHKVHCVRVCARAIAYVYARQSACCCCCCFVSIRHLITRTPGRTEIQFEIYRSVLHMISRRTTTDADVIHGSPFGCACSCVWLLEREILFRLASQAEDARTRFTILINRAMGGDATDTYLYIWLALWHGDRYTVTISIVRPSLA